MCLVRGLEGSPNLQSPARWAREQDSVQEPAFFLAPPPPPRGLPSHGRQWKRRLLHTKFNWREERGPEGCAQQGKPSVPSIYQPALALGGVHLYVRKPHAVFTSAPWGRYHNPSFPAGKGYSVSARMEPDMLNPSAQPLHTRSSQYGSH